MARIWAFRLLGEKQNFLKGKFHFAFGKIQILANLNAQMYKNQIY